MPENTITSTANRIHTDVDYARKRQESGTQQRVQQEGVGARSRDEGVEVTLSDQSRDLQLDSTQVVAGASQTERSTRAAEPAVASTPSSGSASPEDSSETPASETGESGSVTRQYNRSADDSLGTLIDIRS